MSANKAKRRASEPAQGVQQPAARSDGGSVFFARRLVSLLVDYVVNAGVVSIFYACAYIFYLDTSTSSQGSLMLLCAILFVLQTTIYVPWKTGRAWGNTCCASGSSGGIVAYAHPLRYLSRSA